MKIIKSIHRSNVIENRLMELLKTQYYNFKLQETDKKKRIYNKYVKIINNYILVKT